MKCIHNQTTLVKVYDVPSVYITIFFISVFFIPFTVIVFVFVYVYYTYFPVLDKFELRFCENMSSLPIFRLFFMLTVLLLDFMSPHIFLISSSYLSLSLLYSASFDNF